MGRSPNRPVNPFRVTESQAVERTLFEIQTQIGQLRDGSSGLPHSHSKTELSKKIRLRLSQASGELNALVKKLDDNKGNPITRDELERRHRNLEKHQSQHFLLNKEFNALAGQSTIAGSIIRPPGGSLWDDYDEAGAGGSSTSRSRDDEPTDGAHNTLRREDMIRNQNEGLENLSKIISRQKSIALKISEEVNEQDEILDDIAVQLESTDGRINRGTQAIEAFTQKDSSMVLWCIILGLFVAIIIVWFV